MTTAYRDVLFIEYDTAQPKAASAKPASRQTCQRLASNITEIKETAAAAQMAAQVPASIFARREAPAAANSLAGNRAGPTIPSSSHICKKTLCGCTGILGSA